MTSPAETLLAVQLDQAGIPYEREFRFTFIRGWRFDFAFPYAWTAVECEGGIWTQGRHTRGKGFEDDLKKYNEAARLGWKVYRFSSEMVTNGDAFAYITEAFRMAKVEVPA